MAKVNKSVEVSKETEELVQALVKIIKATKDALKDGFQAGQDIPLLVVAAWAELPVAVQGMDLIADEIKNEQHAFLSSVLLGANDMLGVFTAPKV